MFKQVRVGVTVYKLLFFLLHSLQASPALEFTIWNYRPDSNPNPNLNPNLNPNRPALEVPIWNNRPELDVALPTSY